MYCDINFNSKKQLVEYVKNGGSVGVHQPNNVFNVPRPVDGVVSVEGPWYPKPHRWYAKVEVKDCCIVKVQ